MDDSQNSKTTASLLGVPLDLGAQNLGVDIGPEAFRHQGILDKLNGAGFNINDLGNVSIAERNEAEVGDHHLRFLNEIVRVSEESSGKVEQILNEGSKAIVLGGDHSICLGAV